MGDYLLNLGYLELDHLSSCLLQPLYINVVLCITTQNYIFYAPNYSSVENIPSIKDSAAFTVDNASNYVKTGITLIPKFDNLQSVFFANLLLQTYKKEWITEKYILIFTYCKYNKYEVKVLSSMWMTYWQRRFYL